MIVKLWDSSALAAPFSYLLSLTLSHGRGDDYVHAHHDCEHVRRHQQVCVYANEYDVYRLWSFHAARQSCWPQSPQARVGGYVIC